MSCRVKRVRHWGSRLCFRSRSIPPASRSPPRATARVASSHPGLKILYMSGYTDDAVVRHGVLAEGTAFLPKPVSLTGLAEQVREGLGPTSG